MIGKTIQVYFSGFNGEAFKFTPDAVRSVMIKGIIEYVKDVDAFASMIVSSNSFGIKHYDKVRNIVTFIDDVKKKGVILPFIYDDLNYDVDVAYCFLATKQSILNSHGKLIPVRYVIPLEHATFMEHFKGKEKEMLPMDFLNSVRSMYKSTFTKQSLKVNDVEAIEKYIGEKGLSDSLLNDLMRGVPDPVGEIKSMLHVIEQKLEGLDNAKWKLREVKGQPLQVLQQTKAR